MFNRHLRDRHCTKEGGSYVCRYGYNGVCASLPVDGVNDHDYESHVTKYHVNQISKGPETWSVFSAAQNLPAVLNDPGKHKQTNFFTKKWGDSFIEKSHIPPNLCLDNIMWNDFDVYLKKIGKRYRRHARFIQNSKESQSPTSVFKQLNDLGNASLSDIPEIFIRQNLELHNPTTFATVFPVGVIDVEHGQQSGRLLQEKLSHYLDIVEVQIAKQVLIFMQDFLKILYNNCFFFVLLRFQNVHLLFFMQ